MENKIQLAKATIKQATEDGHLVVNFSGGKDSSAILCLVCDMLEEGELKPSQVSIYHSDTKIEYPLLVSLTHRVLAYVKDRYQLDVRIGVAPVEQRFFALMFGHGYPVPSHFVRWCTDKLKIKPGLQVFGKDVVRLTGEHLGESNKRDRKLKACGSSECGTDKLKKAVEKIVKPIVDWSNCNVWDYLFLSDNKGLMYEGFFNHISKVYEISNDDDRNTSLRMGCISCPVVNTTRAYNTDDKGIPNKLSLKLRLVFEAMRGDENRVKNPRAPKNGTRTMGAIALPVRRYYWSIIENLCEEFEQSGVVLVSEPEKQYIRESLANGRYPQTYKAERIQELETEWLSRAPQWLKEITNVI